MYHILKFFEKYHIEMKTCLIIKSLELQPYIGECQSYIYVIKPTRLDRFKTYPKKNKRKEKKSVNGDRSAFEDILRF